MDIRKALPRRSIPDEAQFEEVRAILREANRADPETLAIIAIELRAQTASAPPRVQAEIDGVINRYRAARSTRTDP